MKVNIPTDGVNTDLSAPEPDKGFDMQMPSIDETLIGNIMAEGLKIDLFSGVKPGEKNNEIRTLVEELAEDMVDLFKKLSEITDRLTHLENVMVKTVSVVELSAVSVNRELDQIKDKLLGDRKEITSRATFNALMPALESLYDMKYRYELNGDEALLKNTISLIGILNGILQSLHYTAYVAKAGDLFDPVTMECIGFEKGEEGKITRIERPGFKSGSLLIRPCAVLLGKPI